MAGPLILEESPPARRKGDLTRYGQVHIKSLTLLRSLSSFRCVTPRMSIAFAPWMQSRLGGCRSIEILVADGSDTKETVEPY